MNAKLGQICVFWKAVLLGAAAVTSCLAGTIYSDLGPGGAYIVNRDYETNFDFMATPFVTTGGGSLAEIVIPLFSLNNPVSLSLYSDSGGQPGSVLENWSVTVPGFPGLLTTIPSALNPFLSPGTEYWIVISLTTAQKDHLAWYQNSQGLAGGIWAGNVANGLLNFVPASPAPALELDSLQASATPEPHNRILIGVGLLALACAIQARARRRRQWMCDQTGILRPKTAERA